MRSRLLPFWRLALFGMLLLAVFVVTRLTGTAPSASKIERWGSDLGAIGPPVFVLLGIGLSCMFIPFPLIGGAAGALFGVAGGTAVAMVIAVCAAVTQMTIARTIGAPPVAVAGRRAAIDRFLESRGAVAVFYTRLVPGLPYVPLNYAAGTTTLRRRDMALGTAIAAGPRCFAYAALGGSLDNLDRPEAKVAVAVLVAMALVGLLAARYRLPGGRRG